VFQTFEMSSAEWTMLLLLSASIIPGVELMKLTQRLLAKTTAVEQVLGPASRQGR
jgi:hypothetical protein